MITEQEIEIARPPEAVFDHLVDVSNWGAIDPAMLEVSASGRLSLGASGSMRHRRSGMTVKTQWEVTAFQAPEHFEVLITGFGYTLRETVSLDATNGGTRMSTEDVLLPTSLVGRFMVVVSGGIIRRDLLARSARLKAQLEADGSPRD
jgi:hypothetical protein